MVRGRGDGGPQPPRQRPGGGGPFFAAATSPRNNNDDLTPPARARGGLGRLTRLRPGPHLLQFREGLAVPGPRARGAAGFSAGGVGARPEHACASRQTKLQLGLRIGLRADGAPGPRVGPNRLAQASQHVRYFRGRWDRGRRLTDRPTDSTSRRCPTKSIWTVDLAHLLRSFGLDVQFLTVTIGANPNFANETFYMENMEVRNRAVRPRPGGRGLTD